MGRLWNLVKGWWLRLIGAAEMANPEALLEVKIQESKEARVKFNKGLHRLAGMIESLKMQMERGKKRAAVLKAKVNAAVKVKNMTRAGELAFEFQELEKDRVSNEDQLQAQEQEYLELTRQRDDYVKQVRRDIEGIKRQLSRVKMAEAEAELSELASSEAFNPAGMGLGELAEKLDEKVAMAKGRTRAARDARAGGAIDREAARAETEALEADALATMLGYDPANPGGVDLTAPADVPASAVSEDAGADALARMDLGPATAVEG